MNASRQTHDAMKQKLLSLLAKLEPGRVYDVQWRDRFDFGDGEKERGSFTVSRVFVFGSFARGAPTCGDLDLLLQIQPRAGSRLPPTPTAKRAVFGALRNADLFVESAASSTYLANFPEARQIWSSDDPCGAERVDAIAVDPAARRFARKADVLPVSLKRLDIDKAQAEELADAIHEQRITSSWRVIDGDVVDEERWSDSLKKAARQFNEDLGKDTRRCVPFAMECLRNNAHRSLGQRYVDGRHKTVMHVGGWQVRVGRPEPAFGDLDAIDTRGLIMVPKLSSSATNVVWTLTRGPQHPAMVAAREFRAWAVNDGRGVQLIKKNDFSSQRAAQRSIDGWTENTEERPVRLEGAELLAAISSAEEVDVDVDEYGDGETIHVDGDALKFLGVLARLMKRRRR
jgi:hypothetical protein